MLRSLNQPPPKAPMHKRSIQHPRMNPKKSPQLYMKSPQLHMKSPQSYMTRPQRGNAKQLKRQQQHGIIHPNARRQQPQPQRRGITHPNARQLQQRGIIQQTDFYKKNKPLSCCNSQEVKRRVIHSTDKMIVSHSR